MPTNTAGTVAREFVAQTVHYLRKGITYADDGTTVTVGTIPSGAVLLPQLCGVIVTTAFNGATTNTLDIGTSDDTDAWATDLALGTIGFIETDVFTGAAAVDLSMSADTVVKGVVVSTASATAGAGEIVIAYIPDNDG